jgi:hypothetical protein
MGHPSQRHRLTIDLYLCLQWVGHPPGSSWWREQKQVLYSPLGMTDSLRVLYPFRKGRGKGGAPDIVMGSGFVLEVAGGCGDLLLITFLVTWVVTLLNLRATSMARLGVALVVWACYFEDIEASP